MLKKLLLIYIYIMFQKQFKSAVTVMSLLGVAWIFGFFLVMQGVNLMWLRYRFIIFNSTQVGI